MEVEAYIGEEDAASHARFGRTSRNAVMYGPPGVAYVYLVYGMYECLNVVAEPSGSPAAVLIRAVEPIEGIEAMRAARRRHDVRRRKASPRPGLDRLATVAADRLASGPGLVCAAFDIDRTATGTDLLDPSSPLRIEPAAPADREPAVVAGARVGIAYAAEPWRSMPWRFVDATSPSVSGRPSPSRQTRPQTR